MFSKKVLRFRNEANIDFELLDMHLLIAITPFTNTCVYSAHMQHYKLQT